ncbi:MAG TPA: alpha/beta hydrolase [Solirubrobacteraceae bacterium]|nr:alpha/beta hydrolase [Solirubrobacteraceae bacterium]
MVEHVVDTPDGRRLQVLEDGDPRGTPMLAHNGTPNCRRMPSPVIAKATARGIRLISYDRPGYGGSSRRPNRTVADCCDDVIAIASTLGLERLPVWGISGGGPHALACAALLPELVPAVGVIASGAPWDADGLDYLAGMGELNAEDIRLIISDKAAARAKCEADRLEALALEADDLAEYLQTLLAPVDREQLTPELAQYLVTTTREGLAPGADGWWDDNVAELGPWGFELGAIRTPVLLLHGRQDRFVPFAHGEWLARHIPGVQAELSDEDGHLSLLGRIDRVYDWLLEHV